MLLQRIPQLATVRQWSATCRCYRMYCGALVRPSIYTNSFTKLNDGQPLIYTRAYTKLPNDIQSTEEEVETVDPSEYPELYLNDNNEDSEIDTDWFVDHEFEREASLQQDFVPLWKRRAIQNRWAIQQTTQDLMDSGKLSVDAIKQLLEESKMDNVVVLDLRQKCDWTDYMVIADTSKGERYLSTVAEHIGQVVRKVIKSSDETTSEISLHIEGRDDNSGWLLIDLGRYVIHLFTPEKREYYDLEGLWNNASAQTHKEE